MLVIHICIICHLYFTNSSGSLQIAFYSACEVRLLFCRHPDYHQRPNFSALLCAISQPSYVLFHWFEEDKQAAGPECDVIGAPIEAGCNLYIDLQNFFK